ncbi:MAG TPA: glycosyltransferase family 9 protein [Phycisphaerae bacterium]|nr:glycosyltransferase family 9 protein [Phycisphaerae bacterium]
MKRSYRDTWKIFTRFVRGMILATVDVAMLAEFQEPRKRTEGAIFCLHGLGDLLLAGNAIERLAAHMHKQGLRSVLYVQPALVEFARQNFPVDHIEGIDRRRFERRRNLKYRATVIRNIRGRFAVAIQPTYNRTLMVEDCLIRATGAPMRIGSAGHAPFITSLERKIGDHFYTQIVNQEARRMHELERYAEFMTAVGMPISSKPWRLIAGFERKNPVTETAYMVVCPKASDAKRSWPLENFLQATRELALRHKLKVVMIGTEKDNYPLIWPQPDKNAPELIDLRGKIPTEDLPAVLVNAKLILVNDSGVYHLGVSLDCRVLAVGGSGIPSRYFPYPAEFTQRAPVIYKTVPCAGCDWKCIYNIPHNVSAPCIQDVSWQQVAEAGNQLLNQET